MTFATAATRFLFRRLAFTGPNVPEANLDFVDGPNVVWGASNTGKSFLVKALDFMMGGSTPLPGIEERQGYDSVWLQMVVPRGKITLSRSTSGGDFAVYDGFVEASTKRRPRETLLGEHAAKGASLSGMLLQELGVGDHKIAKNQYGEKATFTFRHFATYVFTEETDMIGAGSPIQISDFRNPTFDKNVLKFVVTGVDGSSIVETKSPKAQKSANAGKIEIVEEMLAAAERELERDFPGAPDLYEQQARISASAEEYRGRLTDIQQDLDTLARERRSKIGVLADANEQATEISLMLSRFALLEEVYSNDLERLKALGEGGAALMAGARRTCPLCGADPEHQREEHGFEEVEKSQRAVRAEMAKIGLERSDLRKAMTSLEAERTGLERKVVRLKQEMTDLDEKVAGKEPLETSGREQYERFDRARSEIAQGIALFENVEGLRKRKADLDAFKAVSTPKRSISVGVDGVVGHALSKSVRKVLDAWKFPGLDNVSFNDASHDILINGKDRASNGKGVRALMNAAFKIGILQYCRDNALPHPGIVVLDSPLLSYREPLTSRHGPLTPDEELVRRSGVKAHFFKYLLNHAEAVQFIIIENDAPTEDLGPMSKVTIFAGSKGDGAREGLFPRKAPPVVQGSLF